MAEANRLSYRLRVLAVSLLIVASLLLLPFLLSMIFTNPTVQAASSKPVDNLVSSAVDNSPNVVTAGMVTAADRLNRGADATQAAISTTSRSVARSITLASVSSGKFIVHTAAGSAKAVASGISGGFGFMVHGTGKLFSSITHPPSLGSIIRPSDADKTPLPVIDSPTAEQEKAIEQAGQKTEKTNSQPNVQAVAQWPIHGAITTEFGASDWPYQAVHTGIDISDTRLGITPVHPFKPGTVIQAIHSRVGLGNHIIVDHGSGITSVYGHLDSISVQVGQQIDKNTVLGYEGTTGASTGPHVHFEIRLNGQPMNPHNYITGQP